ncbi:MAG: sulfotransferase [Acidobacteriota bacterium]
MTGNLDNSDAEPSSVSPICIAGMHRSGTSMVSRLLNLCGLYLGPDSELVLPASDNPEGFWENVHFVELNERILAQFDAGWDLPPTFSKDWESRPEIIPLLTEAADLIHRFSAHEPWCWKDPRNSLTLPFWTRLIPDLKVVICLRNPLEVAQSLHLRNFSSIAFGLRLWLEYYQLILSTVKPENRVVTHYDAYFYAPKAELRRVVDLLNIPASQKYVDGARLIASANLRHQIVPIEVLSSKLAPDILKCYLDLCEQAGPVYQASLGKNGHDSVLWQLDEQDRITHAQDDESFGSGQILRVARRTQRVADLKESLKAQADESNRSFASVNIPQAREEKINQLQDALSESQEDHARLLPSAS